MDVDAMAFKNLYISVSLILNLHNPTERMCRYPLGYQGGRAFPTTPYIENNFKCGACGYNKHQKYHTTYIFNRGQDHDIILTMFLVPQE